MGGLAQLDDVSPVGELAERRILAGDAAFVADLGLAVRRACRGESRPPWQYASVLERVLRLLTLTPGAVGEAVRFLSEGADRRGIRYAASLLASAHTSAELGVVFSSGRSEELRVCLVQELVLRGEQAGHPWVSSPHWRYHPLAWLPTTLTAVEGRPDLPRYSLRGSVQSRPQVAVRTVRRSGVVPVRRDITTADISAVLGTAVADWTAASNGRVETRVYAFDGDLAAGAVVPALAEAGMESTRGLDTGAGSCSVGEAWNQLFAAASMGGAYTGGRFGAYGRLAAWQSVAGLAGADEDAPYSAVVDLAQRCEWYSFGGVTDWFDRVAWDIGLAVVSPDRRRLAVLAATDTD